MRLLITTLGILGLIYVSLCVLLYIFQNKLIYFPVKNIEFTPRDIGLVYEDVAIKTSDDVNIHGWYIPTDSASKVILFCHGNAGNISHRLESIKVFNDLSLNVMIFDYRGFGKSAGRPDELGTCLDAEAAWNYLRQQKSYNPDQIIIFGRSLGSGVAAGLANERNPAAVILESSFTSLPDLAARIYPFFPVRFLARYEYPSIRYLKNITAPILFIHSTDDEIIPFALGRENFEAAREPKYFLEIRGSHNEGFIQSDGIYRKGISDFLKSALSRHPMEE